LEFTIICLLEDVGGKLILSHLVCIDFSCVDWFLITALSIPGSI